ncbi:4-carboxymuconolactone decarboxylase [Rhizobium sp. rho-13.1]|nr:4-carboxymuconolactone decarboxylase [Rhizobium sp. rho-13.1]TQY06649.1 4-carboxymuconolactone decarboxylase [Rhizobium sp. rho-1.1]
MDSTDHRRRRPIRFAALEKYTQQKLLGEVWSRPDLSRRDRSVITVAEVIARNQASDMPFYFKVALDSGVNPAELSEIITHLAFYSGFPNAMEAVAAAKTIFAERGITIDQLPIASPTLLLIDEEAEAKRATTVETNVGPVSVGVVKYTGELFTDLWLRPDLDRSLVTISALVATGQVAQVTFHLNKAMDNGLTKAQASEVLTHLAFYTGWPNVMSAVPVFKDVFEKRGV